MPKPVKKLVFYVDTECSFSNQKECSYYSSTKVRKLAGEGAKKVWGRNCCPMVYLKSGQNKFTAFCPTRGGAWGQQLPSSGGPTANAVRVEVACSRNESWAELVEKAAKTACEAKC